MEMPNVILGHESVGVVEEVGSLVKHFKPGDKVVVPCCTPNWEEPALQERGINNAHDAGWIQSFKFMISHDGVFAEHYKVNNADANLVHLPDVISIEDALMTVDRCIICNHDVENMYQAMQLVRCNGNISNIAVISRIKHMSFRHLSSVWARTTLQSRTASAPAVHTA